MSDPTQPDAKPGDLAPPDAPTPDAPGAGPTLCPDCGGDGQRDGEQCPTCLGTGTVTEPVGGG